MQTPPSLTELTPIPPQMKNFGKFGRFLSGLAMSLAMLAFVLALSPDVLRRLQPQPERPVGQVVRDGIGKFSDGVTGLFSDRYDVPPDAPPAQVTIYQRIEVAADLLAIFALLVAALGWVMQERSLASTLTRPVAVALAFSVAALAYSLQVKALCALAAALLVLAVCRTQSAKP